MANFVPADDSHAGPGDDPAGESALLAARNAAVVCDLAPLGVLALTGADAATFLQGQVSCDVKAVTPGAGRFGSFNSPKGRVLANFVLWRDAALEGGFAMLLSRDISDSVAKRLRMYVLRSKVSVTDVSATTQRIGVGGPAATAALQAAVGIVPGPLEVLQAESATVLGLPGPRYVLLAPAPRAESVRARLETVATPASFDVWRWLTIQAGVPVITAATQDAFVAQGLNLDVLGGIDFQKGCYTGQEIIARTQYLGRLKERTLAFHAATREVAPGDRIFSSAFEGQACGTVINAAPSPGGGCDLLAVVQIAAAERGDARLRDSDGPSLVALALPYVIPAPKAPREREA